MYSPIRTAIRVPLILLCFLGLSISAWLTYQKLTGNITNLVGCGQESSCANILGSKWSVVFKVIPVSIFSLGLYSVLLLHIIQEYPWSQKVRAFSAWLLLFAAIWFIGLQAILFREFCPYCMVSHGIGTLTALLLLSEKASIRSWKLAITALGGVLILGMIQTMSEAPDTHSISDASELRSLNSLTSSSQEHGRFLSYLDGKKVFHLNNVPHIGNPEAQHVLVKYFDYTCESCRATHEQLKVLMKQYPDRYAIILLPVPLNPDCNPYFSLRKPEHLEACFLAHYAITIWFMAPEKFADYHDWLMTAPSEKEAKAKAENLLGKEAFARGLRDQRVRVLFEQNIQDYKALSTINPVMPKILLGKNLLMHGRAKDVLSLSITLQNKLGKSPD